jgi:hypothetical protein
MTAAQTDSKRLATLRAQAALAGVTLHEIEGDDGRPIYIVTRSHLTRELRALNDVEAWLLRVTGATA